MWVPVKAVEAALRATAPAAGPLRQTASMGTSSPPAAPVARDWLRVLPWEADGLRLRTLRPTDLDAFLVWRSDPEVARYQGWMPMDATTALAFLQSQAWASPQPAGTWRQIGVTDAANDRLLGDVGIWLFPDARAAELGISVAPAAQGRGVGRWAIASLCELLFAHAGVERIRAAADVRNLPCLRMLEAAGLHHCGLRGVVSKGEACEEQIFERVRPGAAPCDT